MCIKEDFNLRDRLGVKCINLHLNAILEVFAFAFDHFKITVFDFTFKYIGKVFEISNTFKCATNITITFKKYRVMHFFHYLRLQP